MPKTLDPLIKLLKGLPKDAQMWVAIAFIVVGGLVTALGHTVNLGDTIRRVEAVEARTGKVEAKVDANSLAVVELRTGAKATDAVLTRLDGTLTRFDLSVQELSRAVARLEGQSGAGR